MTDEMRGMIERIEGATGPDRKIDLLIAEQMGWQQNLVARARTWSPHNTTEALIADVNNDGYLRGLPAYTGSLDAVRTLIDPADEWELSTIYNFARAAVGINRDHETAWPGQGEHQGGDPVLALLAASLRALSTMKGPDNAQ